jgi:HEAT repeat protein
MKALSTALLLLVWAAALQAQDAHIQRLGDELRSPDMGVRRQAAIGLGRASQPQSVLLLRQALPTEEEESIRLEIVRALRNIAFLRFPGYRQALDALAQATVDTLERDELVRLRATEALWEAGKKDLLDPVPILERTLGDRSDRVRLASVDMLRKLGTIQALNPLGRTALDRTQSETIRLQAIEALGAVSLFDVGAAGRSVEQNNIKAAQRLGTTPLTSTKALERRHQLQVQYLAAVVREASTSPTLALKAVKSLGQVKDKSAIPVLREIMETHRNPAVRKQATRVLSHVLARQYE